MDRQDKPMSPYDVYLHTKEKPVGMGAQTCYRNMPLLAQKGCVDFVETVTGKNNAIPKKLYRVNALGRYFARQFDEYLDAA